MALSLLSGMNIFSFDNSMFGAYEQGADDGMLGIVSRMQYVHLSADAPNVAIVYRASGEMYQPESGVRQGGRNRSCSHGAPHEGDATTSTTFCCCLMCSCTGYHCYRYYWNSDLKLVQNRTIIICTRGRSRL